MEDQVTHAEDRADDRPATFREVIATREYQAIYGASALSWLGDSMARAAVAALVYRQTHSALASAATFAISYLPWLGIGPVLTALVERYPYRRVMVTCDLVRMCTMGLVALPGMPLPAMLLLLFMTALLNPPFDAARAALLPRILDGDRYVVGLSLQLTTAQSAQIVGYFVGASLAVLDPRLTLLFDAATFGISACLIGLGVHLRAAELRSDERTHLLRETADGFSLVFGTPLLRSIALLVFGTVLFAVVPEGLAAAWAGQLTDSLRDRGWLQGMIMVAGPVGFVLGSVVVGRIAPATRRRLVRPFGLLAPLALVPALAAPPGYVVVAISGLCGIATSALIPTLNGVFVQALPRAFRARAFGVMQSSMFLLQGAAVFITGALADRFRLPVVVGVWGIGGVALMLGMILTWPSGEHITEAIETAHAMNSTDRRATLPTPPVPAQAMARSADNGNDHAPAVATRLSTAKR
jgi:MFS family permease